MRGVGMLRWLRTDNRCFAALSMTRDSCLVQSREYDNRSARLPLPARHPERSEGSAVAVPRRPTNYRFGSAGCTKLRQGTFAQVTYSPQGACAVVSEVYD